MPLARWRRVPFRHVAVVVFATLAAVGFVPLFGGPGYEHTLATGLFVPSATAVATAIDTMRRAVASTLEGGGGRSAFGQRTPLESLARGIVLGVALAVISLATAYAHAVRIGLCELWGALFYYAETALFGCIMGGAWGFVVGEAVAARVLRRRFATSRRATLLAVTLAVFGPLASAAVSAYRFFTSPMIFAYDPFVGFFSGTLYDTVIDAGVPMLTYRAGSLATLLALATVASLVSRRYQSRFGISLELRTWPRRARGAFGLVSALASVLVFAFGGALGHVSTSASIARDLGAEKHGARCDVVYPATTREQEGNLLVKDCEEELAAVEKRLGTRGPQRIRAFFFRDAEDKKRLMGAAHTYIAKPWRAEVYLQLGGYPHPVLGHELAHVVAGAVGRGPFRIAGELGGLLPNPGLIEGIAVMASPDDDDLTAAQWARAMMQIGILPPARQIFSLAFLSGASSKSYTLAGAFVGWIGETRGMDVVRAWYGGADLTALTEMNWSSLERGFEDYLKGVPLPDEALSFARAKFARPGLFARTCPHLVDALRHDADVCRDTQRYDDAIRFYSEAVRKDANDFSSQREIATIQRRHGDREKGRAALVALATADDKRVPRTSKDRAAEALADADFVDGAFEEAAARYDALILKTIDEDAARTLEVKALGARDTAARGAVQALLLGDSRHGADLLLGGVELGAWHASAPSALVDYLLGRNLASRGFYEKSAVYLDSALERDAPTPRVWRETIRQRAIVACALDDRASLRHLRLSLESSKTPFREPTGGRRFSIVHLIQRCSP